MKIFISYASEDALIAAAIEGAFNALASDGFSTLDVYRDVHTFQQGRPIKGQILDELRRTDILFVVYSKKLKRSHSYTGFEVGAFSAMMDEEVRNVGKTERRIVSLFLDEAPQTEQDVLGIKLNVDAIRPETRPRHDLGLSGDFARFLGDVSDILIDRQFPKRLEDETIEHYAARVKTARDRKKADIRDTIIPKLEAELTLALASVVERFSIEQKFIELRWNPSKVLRVSGLRDDVVVTADSPDVLGAFGGYDVSEQISWGKLKKSLIDSNTDGGVAHFINALEYVVGSALSSAPLDNDQLVLGADKKLYRIIVTRHYAYFDGGRTMHVYFIPLLTESLDGPAYRAFVLLRLATRFRMMFLDEGAPLSPEAFELNQMNVEKYKSKIFQFVREIAFTAGQSHTYQLDDPQKFVTYLNPGDRPTNDDIAKLYADWNRETDKVLAIAAEVEGRKANLQSFIQKWNKSLRDYFEFIEPINRSMGAQAAARLYAWYEPDGPPLVTRPPDRPERRHIDTR